MYRGILTEIHVLNQGVRRMRNPQNDKLHHVGGEAFCRFGNRVVGMQKCFSEVLCGIFTVTGCALQNSAVPWMNGRRSTITQAFLIRARTGLGSRHLGIEVSRWDDSTFCESDGLGRKVAIPATFRKQARIPAQRQDFAGRMFYRFDSVAIQGRGRMFLLQ